MKGTPCAGSARHRLNWRRLPYLDRTCAGCNVLDVSPRRSLCKFLHWARSDLLAGYFDLIFQPREHRDTKGLHARPRRKSRSGAFLCALKPYPRRVPLELSWIKPAIDVAHRWCSIERAFANRFDRVAAAAFFLKDGLAAYFSSKQCTIQWIDHPTGLGTLDMSDRSRHTVSTTSHDGTNLIRRVLIRLNSSETGAYH